jgi:uncharacterized protein YdeI (YjbR/CyaY-like superfamily)
MSEDSPTPMKLKPKVPSELPVLLFPLPADWADWLAEHHATASGLWLRLAKKAADLQSVNYQEALDVALCYGWIDGQKKTYDAESWLQKFTPRGKKSIWSKINRAKAEALIASGQMQPAGLRAIESAKQDGRWEAAYDSYSTAEVPEDLQAALNGNAQAQAFFDTLNRQNRYAILFRIQTAKKAETRAKRIAQFVEMLVRGETVHP